MTIGTSSTIYYDPFRHAGDDMISVLLEAEIDDGSGTRRLTESELVAFIMLLAGAGVETVARLLSWAAVPLARFPRWDVDPCELVPVQTSTVRGFSSVPIHL
jgi:cytochrome P450